MRRSKTPTTPEPSDLTLPEPPTPSKEEILARDNRFQANLRNAAVRQSPHSLVAYARSFSTNAVDKLVALMQGQGGRVTVLGKDGGLVEVDVPVPAQVQMRAAEIILERGFGKAPQAVLVKDETVVSAEGATSILQTTIHDRIAAIRAARVPKDVPIDLEASALQQAQPAVAPATAEAMRVIEEDPDVKGDDETPAVAPPNAADALEDVI